MITFFEEFIMKIIHLIMSKKIEFALGGLFLFFVALFNIQLLKSYVEVGLGLKVGSSFIPIMMIFSFITIGVVFYLLVEKVIPSEDEAIVKKQGVFSKKIEYFGNWIEKETSFDKNTAPSKEFIFLYLIALAVIALIVKFTLF